MKGFRITRQKPTSLLEFLRMNDFNLDITEGYTFGLETTYFFKLYKGDTGTRRLKAKFSAKGLNEKEALRKFVDSISNITIRLKCHKVYEDICVEVPVLIVPIDIPIGPIEEDKSL